MIREAHLTEDYDKLDLYRAMVENEIGGYSCHGIQLETIHFVGAFAKSI